MHPVSDDMPNKINNASCPALSTEMSLQEADIHKTKYNTRDA